MVEIILFWLTCWILPILVVLGIYYNDRYNGETLKEYIVRNNIEIFTFMSFIPCLGIVSMNILLLYYIINRKYE